MDDEITVRTLREIEAYTKVDEEYLEELMDESKEELAKSLVQLIKNPENLFVMDVYSNKSSKKPEIVEDTPPINEDKQ